MLYIYSTLPYVFHFRTKRGKNTRRIDTHMENSTEYTNPNTRWIRIQSASPSHVVLTYLGGYVTQKRFSKGENFWGVCMTWEQLDVLIDVALWRSGLLLLTILCDG